MNPVQTELRLLSKPLGRKARKPVDCLGDEDAPERRLRGTGVEADRQRSQYRFLPLLAALQRLFGEELLRADPEVLLHEALAELGLATNLGTPLIEVDEDRNLRLQDERVDGFEDHVDR